ncbi:hypothetical protein [Streptomyces sp. NPDC015125]|uniref:hypothetical protein n=1 Tax=Streptomyces sp. NPDC015125 TaxID=3364938 RepID=UPI0036F5436D
MAETIDFIGEIHPLLTQFRQMTARHQAQIDGYLDSDGELTDEVRQDFNEAKNAHNAEAHNQLVKVIERLTDLCGPPVPGRAYTLTYAGPERHDGEAPYTFVVNGQDLDDARRILHTLPFFREWYEEQRDWNAPEQDPDVLFLASPRDSHAGIPDLGCYNDLRREQAALWETETVTRELAPVRPELEG